MTFTFIRSITEIVDVEASNRDEARSMLDEPGPDPVPPRPMRRVMSTWKELERT